jgi:hypothetical protein
MLKKFLVLACLSISCASANDKTPAQASEKLFNKADFSDCQNVYGHGEAKLVDGEVQLISGGGNWFFLTKKKYKDFILEAEIKMPKVDEYSNSGIIFRAQIQEKKGKTSAVGYQAEVDPSDRKWSGGLYDQGRRAWLHPKHEKRSKPDADFKKDHSPEWTEERANAYKHLEWNKYRIECRGSEIKIFVNDILTTHVTDTKDAEGYIAIQHHGSKEFKKSGDRTNTIKFRNILITELSLESK